MAKTAEIGARVSAELLAAIDQTAQALRRSRAEIITFACEQYTSRYAPPTDPEPERPATIIGSAGPALIERWDDGTLSLTFSGPGFHGTNGVEMGTVGQLVTALSELPEDALLDELVVTYHDDWEDEGQPWPDEDHGNFIAVLGVRPGDSPAVAGRTS